MKRVTCQTGHTVFSDRTMLLVIDKSITSAAIQGEYLLRSFLDDIVTAIRDGVHLIKIDIDDADTILNADLLSDINTRILRKYADDIVSVGASIPDIVYEGRIIYWKEIESPRNSIIRLAGTTNLKAMDLSLFTAFKINIPPYLWGEGDNDCDFFMKISESFIYGSHINLNFEKRPGGGNNLSEYIKNDAKRQHTFHLCICDNDKHFDDGIYGVRDVYSPLPTETANLGQTSKNILNMIKELSSPLVDVYIYAYCSELENLIPWYVVTEIHPDTFSNLKNTAFDKSFLDIKSGVTAKHIHNNPSFTSYWKANLAVDQDIINDFNQAEVNISTVYTEFMSKHENTLEWFQCKKKYEDTKNTIVIRGKRIQKEIMKSSRYQDFGHPSIHSLLSPNQLREWEAISKRVITWGIAINPPLN